jgi:hypothetical protein
LKSDANDISGNEFDFTTIGTLTYTGGILGGSGYFDAIADACRISAATQQFETVFNNDFTVSF